MYELSVIFLTYNSAPEAVKESLKSIITQKDVDLEVIVADDGSKDNLKNVIEKFFDEYAFTDYKIVLNPENGGIVANLESGLNVAEGEFTKVLSPGDRLCSEQTMRGWLDFMKAGGFKWSFSNAVYYYKDKLGNDVYISGEAHPQDLKPYIKRDDKGCRWNYIVLKDIAIGATLLSGTDIQRKYCKIIKKAGVKYAEDNMWRLLMFEGEVGAYYPKEAVLYETGSGMSTSGSDIWQQRLLKDWMTTDELMRLTKPLDSFQQAMLKGIRDNQNAFQKLLVKGKLRHKISRIINKRMTQCPQINETDNQTSNSSGSSR